jgi:hypothetical protein
MLILVLALMMVASEQRVASFAKGTLTPFLLKGFSSLFLSARSRILLLFGL